MGLREVLFGAAAGVGMFASGLGAINEIPLPKIPLEQRIDINLPAYRLAFYDSDASARTYSIAIGKGNSKKKKKTPVGDAVILEKRNRVVFRYLSGKRKGQKITWTNTFDENGKKLSYKMPYKIIRAFDLKIESSRRGYYFYDYSIHSTTDDYTCGTPASSGCLRISIKDMLQLFPLVEPGTKSGWLKKPVRVRLDYDVVECDGMNVVLHANPYHRKINYVDELKRDIVKLGLDKTKYDFERFAAVVEKDAAEFDKVLEIIYLRLSKDNFLSPQLKAGLHKTYKLDDFLIKS